jgi:hypothetical protein
MRNLINCNCTWLDEITSLHIMACLVQKGIYIKYIFNTITSKLRLDNYERIYLSVEKVKSYESFIICGIFLTFIHCCLGCFCTYHLSFQVWEKLVQI